MFGGGEAAHLSTVEDTARYLGLTVPELEAEISAGHLPIVPAHQAPLIHEADLEAFMARAPRRLPRWRRVLRRRGKLFRPN